MVPATRMGPTLAAAAALVVLLASTAHGATLPKVRVKRAMKWNEASYAAWSAWGACSATCGLGSKTRTRGDETDTKRCTMGPCNNWAEWNAWTQCSATCGRGERMRTRMCPNYFGCASEPSNRVQESMQKEPCLSAPCAGWSHWSAWGACSAYCDGGLQERSRTCSQRGQCEGEAKEERECGTVPCCGKWSAWGSCSKTCDDSSGSAKEQRERKCLATVPGTEHMQPPQYASESKFEDRPCEDLPPCAAWTSWAEWGQCSADCGPGERSRTRECPIPGACVGGEAEEFQPCEDGPCAEWRSWARWSMCSASCGGGSRTRQRVCTQGDEACNGDGVEEEACATEPCPEYSSWGAWGYCSEDCGGGWQVRTRVCNQYNLCAGDKKQKRHCNQHQCPAPSPWGSWGECSVDCGGGFQLRSRTCEVAEDFCSQADNVDSSSCFCEANMEDSQACNPHRCAELQEWGAWGSCSADCGGGYRSRSRTCRNDPGFCVGVNRNHPSCLCTEVNELGEEVEAALEEEGTCAEQACTAWSSWEEWGECSLKCGNGARERKRQCVKDEAFCADKADDAPGCVCPGLDHSNEQCNSHRCPSWARWGRWSACDKDCEGGTRSRTRKCRRDEPFCASDQADDDSCKCGEEEDALIEEECNSHRCAVWVKWTHWSECSASCGAAGVQSRKRDCNRDFSYCFGARLNRDASCQCEGSPTEEGECGGAACPFFAEWSDFGQCSASCAGGKKSRTRECMIDSDYCTADKLSEPACQCAQEEPGDEQADCNQQPCAEWASWTPWNDCTQVCGGGSRTRSRTCPQEGGCPGLNDETEFCNQVPCPDWGNWGPWSDCSVSCNGGQRARTRTCAIQGGCSPGEPLELESCNDDTCPMWTQWGDWGACTVSCGEGVRLRTRECPTGTGSGCPGTKEDEEVCLEQTCQRNTWWSDWSPCTQTCGGGVQIRSRLETLAGPLLEETQDCESKACPEWSAWEAWGVCTATCGSGQRVRERYCEDGDGIEIPAGCVGSSRNIDPSACNSQPCVSFDAPRPSRWWGWN